MATAKAALCRDCTKVFAIAEGQVPPKSCPACGGRRLIHHDEIAELSIAHIDCDAFYAAIEKRDRPELRDKPVIIGGGQRGVVATACYVARMYGVKSAMPMFKALRNCPDAVVIKPNMEKYTKAGRAIRAMMEGVSPIVEPLSIDEAFIDLTGTERLHKRTPAATLAQLALDIEATHGITVSIGLAPNKFLAKIASELDKPRGFSVIGLAEAEDFLADKPVSIIWGVGKKMAEKLHRDGFKTLRDLRNAPMGKLEQRYGKMGKRLHQLSWGRDARDVSPERATKSVSSETTFNEDIRDPAALAGELWRLCERLADRLREKELEGRTVVLKLKTASFKLRTRSQTLPVDIRTAESLYQAAHPMLYREADGTAFRLLGIGLDIPVEDVDQQAPQDLLFDDLDAANPAFAAESDRRKLEDLMQGLRDRMGADAVMKGRSLKEGGRGKK
ncbi:MAG: DNA polymerase IV [Alphaproteobacteria bacterium]|nr:DNA polymerase IV [Alphaproteobacteria bacterium SS10]